MDKHFIELTPQYEEVWILQWVKIILPYLKEEQPHTATSFYQRLLIAAFKINPLILRIMYEFLHKNGCFFSTLLIFSMQYQFRSTPAEFGALLGCLRAARKGGIQINFTDCCSHSYWRGFIEEKTLEVNMFNQNDEVHKTQTNRRFVYNNFVADSCGSISFSSGDSENHRNFHRMGTELSKEISLLQHHRSNCKYTQGCGAFFQKSTY